MRSISAFLLPFTTVLVLFVGISSGFAAEEPFISDKDWGEQERHNPDSTVRGTPGSTALRVVGGLVIVVGMAVAAGIVLKRTRWHRRVPGMGAKHMETLETLHLGAKRSVSLIRVGGKAILVGHGEGAMASLGEFPLPSDDEKTPNSKEPQAPKTEPQPPEPTTKGPKDVAEFRRRLTGLMEKA